jgi:uncharacterized protein YkwD
MEVEDEASYDKESSSLRLSSSSSSSSILPAIIEKDTKGNIDMELAVEYIHRDLDMESTSIETKFEKDRELVQVTKNMELMLALINNEREKAGVKKLCMNNKLNRAALGHSQDLKNKERFSHTGSDGSTFERRMKRAGYIDGTDRGENISTDQTIIDAHNGLMQSKGHRENILYSYFTQIGLGITRYEMNKDYFYDNFIITQVFSNSPTEPCIGTTPTTPNGEDNNNFRFKVYNAKGKVIKVGCDWFYENNTIKRRGKKCLREILQNCPKACTSDLNLQCENKNSFKFKAYNNKGKQIDVGCDWFYEVRTVKRRNNRCENNKIAQNCKKACNLCKCKDSGSDFKFKVWGPNNKKINVGCEWLYGPNSANRKKKFCADNQISRNCPLACDNC